MSLTRSPLSSALLPVLWSPFALRPEGGGSEPLPEGGFVTTYPNSFGTCIAENGITYIEFTYQNQFAEEQSVTFQAFSDHAIGFSVFVDKATLSPIPDPLILAPGATSTPILLAIATSPTEATTYRIQASVGGVPMFETPVVSAAVCPVVAMTAIVERVGAITPVTNGEEVDYLITVTSPVDYPHNMQLQINGDPAFLASPIGATTTTPGATPLDGDPMAGFLWRAEHFLAGVPKQYQITLLASDIVQGSFGASGGFPITVSGSLEGQGNAFTTITDTVPIALAEPAAPTANQRLLPGLSELVGYTTLHTSTTGNIVLRIFARNNADDFTRLAASWDGVPLTIGGQITDNAVGAPIAFVAAIKGGTIGQATLDITCSVGSAGVAAVLIEDVTTFDDDWIGTTTMEVGPEASSMEIPVTPQNAPSNITQVVGWADQLAFPITEQGSSTSIQWNTGLGVATGADILVGGDFSSPTGWTLEAPWSIAGGSAVHPATGVGDIQRAVPTLNVKQYEATYTIADVSGGAAYVYLESAGVGTFYGQPRTAAGSYTDRLFTLQADAPFGLRAEAVTDATFDTASVRLVGGIAGYFVRTATVTAGQHLLTFFPNNAGVNHVAAGVAVEIKGLVV